MVGDNGRNQIIPFDDLLGDEVNGNAFVVVAGRTGNNFQSFGVQLNLLSFVLGQLADNIIGVPNRGPANKQRNQYHNNLRLGFIVIQVDQKVLFHNT